MIKYITTLALVITAFSSFAQNSNSNSVLIRHDTTILKADESEWIIKSLIKNDPALTSAIGKPVPLIILEAIEKGKLKAIDPVTNKPIPAKEIFTWKIPSDTMATYDDAGNEKHIAVQRRYSPDNFSQIRIFEDWYFDVSAGKFHADIKWIELLVDIHSYTGLFLGYSPLCRIYY